MSAVAPDAGLTSVSSADFQSAWATTAAWFLQSDLRSRNGGFSRAIKALPQSSCENTDANQV